MIRIEYQETIYSDIIDDMQGGNAPWSAPDGFFYLINGTIVPFSPKPTTFRVTVDQLNVPVTIEVVNQDVVNVGTTAPQKPKQITVVAKSNIITVPLQLGRGTNKITASIGEETAEEAAFLIVKATSIVTLWEAFARVMYSNSFRISDSLRQAAFSKLGTRLIEPYIEFQDLLPETQSLQTLATRMIARGMIHSVGNNSGVDDVVKALTLTTPYYKSMDKDTMDLFPALDPWTNVGSAFAGQEAHVWIPNVGMSSWVAFLKYLTNQPDLFDVVKVAEEEVVFYYQGQLQRHRFDFDKLGTNFLAALAREDCFASIRVLITLVSNMAFEFCSASYPFDLVIDEDHTIGGIRRTFDEGIPFDSGYTYDSDDVDPYPDGWIGLSLTGRFEQDYPFQHCLDTAIVPAQSYTGPQCCYESFYTQALVTMRSDIDLDITETLDAWVQTAFSWTLQSPYSTKWKIKLDATGAVTATSGSPDAVTDYKVTKPDLSEASFAITDAGIIQVISPPPGGETLIPNLYVIATDGSVWEVTVDNLNQIVTTKVFP